jgi:hypothetical protein
MKARAEFAAKLGAGITLGKDLGSADQPGGNHETCQQRLLPHDNTSA